MVVDIAPGAGLVIALRRLHQRVAVGNRPILGASALRTPAAHGQAESQPDIQGRPVNARLAAADEFVEHRDLPALSSKAITCLS